MLIYKNVLITTKDDQFLGWIEFNIESKTLIKIGRGITCNEGYDCNKKIILPGFIDSHTHGAYGFSFDNDLDNNKLLTHYLESVKKEGVVGIVGTFVTSKLTHLEHNIESIRKIISNPISNNLPSIIAWYFEGPFISKERKGAHEENLIIPADDNFFKLCKKSLGNVPLIFTIDVASKDNQKAILKNYNNFVFALGHSNAKYSDAKKFLNNGIKRITHLYNAMSGFSHSGNLGILNVIFNKEFKNDLCIELIADGVHVANEVIKYTYDNFDINNLTLVTDSLSPKGLPDGEYKLGNLEIDKRTNWFYLKGTNILSGSAIKYNWLLKHFKEVTNCSWSDIVKISSYNSARNLNLPNYYGDFIEGEKLNFCLIDDEFNVIEVFV